ncbi:MAG: CHAT domain-containing protein [Dehalococcoidia bacterium]
MAIQSRASGIQLDLPAGYSVAPATTARGAPQKTRRKGRLSSRPIPLSDGGAGEPDPLIEALKKHDLKVADDMVIRPTGRRGRGAAEARVAVDVARNESAVLLVEQDGVYAWQFASSTERVPTKRGAEGGANGRQRLSFAIPISATDSKTRRISLGGLAGKLIPKKIRTVVLKFAVGATLDAGVKYFERKAHRGLVWMNSTDPKSWKSVDSAKDLKIPKNHPAKILLFVHGTFSSSRGSFGGLGATDEGRKLLEDALRRYDLVLGFDHVTLSEDPLQNAEDLLKRLTAAKWPQPPEIDVVAYSRGGLVARSFLETVLPGSGWSPRIGRAVLVACTNNGTRLAEPDNWRTFIDLYTNLSAGASRAIAVLPHGALAAVVLSEAIQGAGALVKYVATHAVSDGGVPGLSAMEPDGKFVVTLNKTQEGQQTAEAAEYFAITSDFEPELMGANGALPSRLLTFLKDGLIDQLMQLPNDLVVDTTAMTIVDPHAGQFVKDTLDFGSNGDVFHTNYFLQGRTVSRMSRWLQLVPMARANGGGGAAPRAADGAGPAKKAERSTKRAARSRNGGRAPASKRRAAMKKTTRRLNGGGGGGAVAASLPSARAAKRARPATKARRTSERPVPRSRTGTPVEKATRVPARSTVATNFLAEMDDEVVVRQKAKVEVRVSQKSLERAAAKASATGRVPLERRKRLSIHLIPKRNFKVVGDTSVDFMPPEPGERSSCEFVVQATHEGAGEVWVEARQRQVTLLTMKLKPKIVARLSGTAKKARARSTPTADAPSPGLPNTLRVVEMPRGNKVVYLYDLNCSGLKVIGAEESKPIGSVSKFIDNLYRKIEERFVETAGDVEAFTHDLRAIGGNLFDQLVPAKIQKLLWDNRTRIDNIMLLSTEPYVPWELVYLKKPGAKTVSDKSLFLGQMGLVRWLHDAEWHPEVVRVRKGRARFAIPAYPLPDDKLVEAEAERAFLEEAFGATAVTPQPNDVRRLLSGPNAFDLFHFAGHGYAEHKNIEDASLMLEGRVDGEKYVPASIDAVTVKEYARLAKVGDNRPMVVLNACRVGMQGRELTNIGGFAQAFLTRGAGIFVSSLWSVEDQPARTFTETLYRELLKRRTLSQAAKTARQKARTAGDATWLAYVVYGHPQAKLVR